MATRGGLITFTNSQHKDGHPDHAESFQSRPQNHGGQGISHTETTAMTTLNHSS